MGEGRRPDAPGGLFFLKGNCFKGMMVLISGGFINFVNVIYITVMKEEDVSHSEDRAKAIREAWVEAFPDAAATERFAKKRWGLSYSGLINLVEGRRQAGRPKECPLLLILSLCILILQLLILILK